MVGREKREEERERAEVPEPPGAPQHRTEKEYQGPSGVRRLKRGAFLGRTYSVIQFLLKNC